MNRIKGSALTKAAALLLLTVFLLVFIASLLGVIYLEEYPQIRVADSFFEAERCVHWLRQAADQAYNMQNYFDESDFGESWYTMQRNWMGKVDCIVLSPEGEELFRSYNAGDLSTAGHIHTMTGDDVVIKTFVDRALPYGVIGVGADKLMFDFIKAWGDWLTWTLAGSALLSMALVLFLVLCAGHRSGVEGVVPGSLDRMPYDLYLLCFGTLMCLAFSLPVALTDVSGLGTVLSLMVLGLAVSYLCGCGIVATTVVRLKCGGILRNTLIWRWGSRVLGWGWKWIKMLWNGCRNLLDRLFGGLFGRLGDTVRALPLIWKLALGTAAVIFVELLLFLIAMGSWYFNGMALMAFLLFNGFLLLAVCRLGLDMLKLKKAGERLASGEQEETVDTAGMLWDFKSHGEALNSIAQGISRAVEKQLKSERLKTELITNVSHDIKTPLTSIVNYVDLLKKEELTGKAAEYVDVLDRQSARLKKLTEDLVEASKASTGNITVNLTRTDVGEIARQAAGEYTERLEKAKLDLVMNIPDPAPCIMADGRLLWRIIDNLLSNVCKYSQSGTRVYLDIRRTGGRVSLAVKNISRDMLNIDPEELTERFVRGDMSRNTEGSGLGLNIARSLTELQNGSFRLTVDGDLFKAELQFNEIG